MTGNDELEMALEKVRQSASELIRQADSLNEPFSLDISAIKRFGKAAVEVCDSELDELRDNLITAYGIGIRPNIAECDNEYSVLLLDKLFNDTRDALIQAEQVAERCGVKSPVESRSVPDNLFLPENLVKQEILEIKDSIKEISLGVSQINVKGQQFGLINLTFNVEMKIDLAEAILATGRVLDGINIQRIIGGIAASFNSLMERVASASRPLLDAVSSITVAVQAATHRALATANKIVQKFGGNFEHREIWGEAEVIEMLSQGGSVPLAAVPFVRSAQFGRLNRPSMDELQKLIELRNLSLDIGFEKNIGLEKLQNLKKLRKLEINVSDGYDLRWISELDLLEDLRIKGIFGTGRTCQMPDMIRSTNLITLYVSGVNIDKIPVFPDYNNLQYLSLRRAHVADYAAIKSATSLKKLVLRDSNVNDISFVSNFLDLEILDIRNTYVKTIRPAQSLKNLKNIHLSRRYYSAINKQLYPNYPTIRSDEGGLIRRGSNTEYVDENGVRYY